MNVNKKVHKLFWWTDTSKVSLLEKARHTWSAFRLTEVDTEVVLGVYECVQHLAVDVLNGVLMSLLNEPLQHILLSLDVPWTHTQIHLVKRTHWWVVTGMHLVYMLFVLLTWLCHFLFSFSFLRGSRLVLLCRIYVHLRTCNWSAWTRQSFFLMSQ